MERLTYTLCILALFVGLSHQAARSYFQPWGTAQGDSILARNDDDSSPQLPFIGGFQFFGVSRTYLYLNNNGLFSFDGALSTYTPSTLNSVNFPTVAPYWADVDTRPSNGGEVYYRMSQNATLLASLSAWIRAAKPGSTFYGTRMFIATWNNVGYYNLKVDKTCTFQGIIIADDTGFTYAVFNYGDMQWTTGDASNGVNGLGGTPAVAGFSKGDGVTYAQVAGSLTSTIINIASGSNVVISGAAQTGQYLYEVSVGVVITDCCTATPPPVLNNAPTTLNYTIANIGAVPAYTTTVTASLRCPPGGSTSTVQTVTVNPTVFSVYGCPVRRTWSATDSCLRTTEVTQVFTYPEVFSEPLTIVTPADYNAVCGTMSTSSAPSTSITGVATANHPGTNVTYVDGTWTATTCNAASGYSTYTFSRIWTASDICESRKYGTQAVNIVNPGPVVTTNSKCVTPNNLYYCFATSGTTNPYVTAKDKCSNAALSMTYNNDCVNNLGTTAGCVRNGTLMCIQGSQASGRASYTFSYTTTDSCGRVGSFPVTVGISGTGCDTPTTDLFPVVTSSQLSTRAVTSAPLTTSPLTTSPLTTQPLTTSPLTTQPLTTQPLTTQPLTTQPLTTSPLTTQPLTTQPLTTQPLTTQELTTSPLTTQPLTTQPLTTQPLTTQPLTTQPLTTQPLTTQELTTSPLTTQELTTSPLTTQPLTTQPLTTQPLTTQPLTTQPLTTSPLTTQPLTTQPLTTQPLTTQPLTTSPLTTGALTAPQYCAQQTFPEGTIGYYCTADHSKFYMCSQGPWNALSVIYACPAGTGCPCPMGTECSGNGAFSPCRT